MGTENLTTIMTRSRDRPPHAIPAELFRHAIDTMLKELFSFLPVLPIVSLFSFFLISVALLSLRFVFSIFVPLLVKGVLSLCQ
jgi:hypothetical protein